MSKPGVFQMEDCSPVPLTALASLNSKADEAILRIKQALDAAASALGAFTPGCIRADEKSGGRGPVTEADRVVSNVLREALVREDEGWFSEESVDDLARLEPGPGTGTMEELHQGGVAQGLVPALPAPADEKHKRGRGLDGPLPHDIPVDRV